MFRRVGAESSCSGCWGRGASGAELLADSVETSDAIAEVAISGGLLVEDVFLEVLILEKRRRKKKKNAKQKRKKKK